MMSKREIPTAKYFFIVQVIQLQHCDVLFSYCVFERSTDLHVSLLKKNTHIHVQVCTCINLVRMH